MSEKSYQIRLECEPLPENVPRLADKIRHVASEVSGVDLDYTPESLARVDSLLESFRTDGATVRDIATTLFLLGCYVGEVFVRNNAAKWRKSEDTSFQDFTDWPLVVELGPGKGCNPIGKTFKRFENGEEDSLVYFYQVFTR